MINYVPNKNVLRCIEEKDLASLREYIGTIVYTDRAFLHGEFESAIKYIVEDCYLVEIFEPFNQHPPLKSKLGYTDYQNSDFTEAIYELKNNFCRERIEDVKIIGKTLYSDMQKQAESLSENKAPAKKISFFDKIFKR